MSVQPDGIRCRPLCVITTACEYGFAGNGVIHQMERVFVNDREYMARVRAMEGRLYRVAQAILWRQADSVDAVQEAVLRGWMKKGSLKDPERFEAWLTRILVNQCRDMLRRRKREDAAELADIPSEDRLCEDLQLRMALKRLPEKYRLPLLLHHMEGWSIQDVARMLNIPQGLAKSRLYQARKALRALLDGGDGK